MVQKLLPKNSHQTVHFFLVFQVHVILLKSQQEAQLDPGRIHLPPPTEGEQELTALCAELDFSCCHCDMKAFGLSSPHPARGVLLTGKAATTPSSIPV